MRVTCPKCQLKGLVDSGPLMLQTRALCVRCATSYEAVLVNGKVETFLPSSNGHSQAGEVFEWNLLEAEPLPDEPLELPGPVLAEAPLMQTEYVLEDLSAESPFEPDLGLLKMNFAHAQAESKEAPALPLEEAEEESSSSHAPEDNAWLYEESAVLYADNALPYEDDASPSQEASSWPSEEDEALPDEEDEALLDEEAVQPSEAEVSPLSLVSSSPVISSSPVVSPSPVFSSSSFEADVLPASEMETERHESLPDVSTAPDSPGLMDVQPVGFVHTVKDVLPYQDKYSLGVRLMRVSPVWLLASGLLFISLIFAFNWATKPNAQANNLTFNHALNSSATNTATRQTASPAPAQTAEGTNSATERNPSMEVKAASTVNDAPLANEASLAKAAPAVGPAPATNPAAAAVNTSHAVETKAALEVNQPQVESRGSGNFTVQVGSYSDSVQAEARAASLRSAGFDARLVAVELPRRGTWYRVQAGRFETREEAARYGQQLRTQKVAAETIITEIQNQ